MKRISIILTAILASLILAAPTLAASPDHELVYADGNTYSMLGVTLLTQASPGLLNAPPIYVVGFAVPPTTAGPITLPSGYQPQCNPCTHGAFAYHDHVLTGAPGFGTSGTAHGDYSAPWRIVVMLYNPAYSNSPSFVPITSDEQIPAAEAAHELVPINPGTGDAYQIWTPMVLICPVVQRQG